MTSNWQQWWWAQHFHWLWVPVEFLILPLAEPTAEPSCLGMGTIDLETGTKFMGPVDNVYASMVNAMVGAWSMPNTLAGTILSGKYLKVWECFNECWRKEFCYSPCTSTSSRVIRVWIHRRQSRCSWWMKTRTSRSPFERSSNSVYVIGSMWSIAQHNDSQERKSQLSASGFPPMISFSVPSR